MTIAATTLSLLILLAFAIGSIVTGAIMFKIGRDEHHLKSLELQAKSMLARSANEVRLIEPTKVEKKLEPPKIIKPSPFAA